MGSLNFLKKPVVSCSGRKNICPVFEGFLYTIIICSRYIAATVS